MHTAPHPLLIASVAQVEERHCLWELTSRFLEPIQTSYMKVEVRGSNPFRSLEAAISVSRSLVSVEALSFIRNSPRCVKTIRLRECVVPPSHLV